MRKTLAGLLVAGLLAGALGCQPSKPQGARRGEALYGNCVTCHGADGSGNRDYKAPDIAGLEPWYVRAQLEKFREGIRGAHPDDGGGLRMGPMAQMLDDDEDLDAVAAYVAGLEPVDPPPALQGGDATRGEELYATCVECHGDKARGDENRGAPALHHTDDWYLLTQLEHFKKGVRGADPRDETGAQMRGMVASLGDTQAMKDVLAYIETLPD